MKLLPAEWYETIRDDIAYVKWETVKSAFLTQFDKVSIRPREVMARGRNCSSFIVPYTQFVQRIQNL